MNKLLLFGAILAIIFTSCSDDDGVITDINVPVTGVELPESDATNPAIAGTSVTIKGEGFTQSSEIWLRETATKATSDVEATVTSVSETQITFTAPDIEGSQSIVHKKDGDEQVLGNMVFAKPIEGAIIIGEKEYPLDSEAQDLPITVSSNVDIEVEIPSDVDWISVAPATKAMTEKVITLTITENSYSERTAKVTFKNSATDVSETITVTQAGVGTELDRQALIAFYNATGGGNWTDNTNWCSDKPIGEWYGVSGENRVVNLNLPGNNLTGEIPFQIGVLSKLESLYLMDNQLTGSIPAVIGDLTNLTNLNLRDNQFAGSVPSEIGKLTNLAYLDLGNNKLTSLPSEIDNLTKLKELDVRGNQLTSIPATIANMPNLYRFFFGYNNLSGAIPSFLFEHPYWDEYWRLDIKQNNGFAFDLTGVSMKGAKHIVTDIDGKRLDFSDIYSRYKYTVLLQWTINCNLSEALIGDLVNVYRVKHFDGLEVIAYPRFGQNHDDYIQQSGMSIWNNFYIDGVNSSVGIWGHIVNPSAEVIDQNGNVVFACVGNANTNDDRIGRNAFHELIPFLEEKMGTVKPPVFYESSDYSKDGDVLTLQRATSGDGIDLVIVGDGFSDKDMASNGKYEQRMSEAMDHFFSEEPYKTYRNRYNVYSVKAVSKNEVYKDGTETAFSCEFGDGTLISGDDNKVFKYALKVPSIPNIDNLTVITVLNSSNYAGTCYMYYDSNASVSYCPVVSNDDEQYRQIITHEAGGHGFAKLMDEYNYSGTITTDAISWYRYYKTLDWAANVDVTNDPATISWAHLLSDTRYNGLVGIYEGALTFQYGAYRPTDYSIMHHNTGGYNAPSREAIYKWIMKFSGDTYNYEDFVVYDAKNRTSSAVAYRKSQAARVDMRKFVPLAPPVILRSKPNAYK